MLVRSAVEGQQEKMQEIQEAVERFSEKNRMPSGISESLAKYFLQYDIPVSEEKMDKINLALEQTFSVDQWKESSTVYVLKNNKDITRENIFQDSYLKTGMASQYAMDLDAVFDGMIDQVERVVTEAGYPWDDTMQERTKWLFQQEIPISKENLDKYDQLLEWPSFTIACANTVAVVVPSPASSPVLEATSFTN